MMRSGRDGQPLMSVRYSSISSGRACTCGGRWLWRLGEFAHNLAVMKSAVSAMNDAHALPAYGVSFIVIKFGFFGVCGRLEGGEREDLLEESEVVVAFGDDLVPYVGEGDDASVD